MTPVRPIVPIGSTVWKALVDHRRLDQVAVLDILKRLAIQSVAHLYQGGDPPRLSRRDIGHLRPLVARPVWTWGLRRRAVAIVLDAVHLSANRTALIENDVAVLTTASIARRGWHSRFVRQLGAARSPLLEGIRLFEMLVDTAWSDPTVGYALLDEIRGIWRRTVLFHPDEPEWPSVSVGTIRIIVAAALERRLWSPTGRAFVAAIDGGLDSAIEGLESRPQTERLIVLDAVGRAPEAKKLAATVRIRLAAATDWPPVSGMDDEMDPATRNRSRQAQEAPFVERLAGRRI